MAANICFASDTFGDICALIKNFKSEYYRRYISENEYDKFVQYKIVDLSLLNETITYKKFIKTIPFSECTDDTKQKLSTSIISNECLELEIKMYYKKRGLEDNKSSIQLCGEVMMYKLDKKYHDRDYYTHFNFVNGVILITDQPSDGIERVVQYHEPFYVNCNGKINYHLSCTIDGALTKLRKNGTSYRISNYQNGVLHGGEFGYFPDGLFFEYMNNYENGILHGDQYAWYPNQTLKAHAKYEKGILKNHVQSPEK
jgi:antitoxin component YwqK of YwqJK toxin-antitoxin module